MRRETDEMNLTAYALGELGGAEREAVEARLLASADDRRFVDEVRAGANLISEELARERREGLDAIHYAAIELRLRDSRGPAITARRDLVRGRIGFVLSLAASVAIVGGAVGLILLSLSRHSSVAIGPPNTQPSGGPILIPLEGTGLEDVHSQGVAMGPQSAESFVNAADHPVSSFAMETDAAAYEDVRRALSDGRLPTRESVKIEGLVNAFSYDDPAPAPGAIFGARVEIGQCPWHPDHRLARIAVKARAGDGIVATDVRAEVAFVPAAVQSYRLLGYEGDASGKTEGGDSVAAGHAVTALYEVVPAASVVSQELLTVHLRYRATEGAAVQTTQVVGRDTSPTRGSESADFRFAAAVAEFAMALRDSSHGSKARIANAIALAQSGVGADSSGQRRAFIDLARQAEKLIG